MAAIKNDMKILNDSINQMPTMVTVNQNQNVISSNHSSSKASMNKISSRQGALAGAGAAMMGAGDSSRNNNQAAAVTVGNHTKGNLVMVNPNNMSRTASNHKDIDNFISGS